MSTSRINLATRPFYNERAAHLLLAAVALAAAGVLAAGSLQLAGLYRERAALAAEADRTEAEARSAADEAQDLLRQLAGNEPDAVAAAAAEANALIERRLFSWTELFNHIERTLPAGVMLVSVQPEISGAGGSIALEVIGRSVAAIGAFIEALEATGAFSGVLPQDEEATGDGAYRTRLVARYAPQAPPAGDAAAARGAVP